MAKSIFFFFFFFLAGGGGGGGGGGAWGRVGGGGWGGQGGCELRSEAFVKIQNQRTNGPVNAHLISWPTLVKHKTYKT